MAEPYELPGWQSDQARSGRFLTFPIANETYGLEIRHVTQIVGMQSVTEVPEAPYYVKGIINLRGKIIPMLDVRLRFGKPEREYDDRTCVIVADCGGRTIGLIVDRVSEVLTIYEGNIEAPPVSSAGFISGIGKLDSGVVLIVDCARIFAGIASHDASFVSNI